MTGIYSILLLLILSSPNSKNHNKTYQSGIGELGTYNSDFAMPVHIVAAPFCDVTIGEYI